MSFYNYLILQANETVNLIKNETVSNSTFVATKEEKIFAYLSILVMAVVPIILGAFKSAEYLEKKLKSNEKPELMSTRDVAMFPVIASFALFSLYIVFKVFSKNYINLLLTAYFYVLGVYALTHSLAPFLNKIFHSTIRKTYYFEFFTKENEEGDKESLIDLKFTAIDVISLVLSNFFGLWYLFKKHWLANNLLGIAFAINGIEFLHLNTILNGITLLWGLFFYDIFWVFGTDVMVTVAKSFEAPIKLVFPQDILRNGLLAKNFAMLGLGDIVVPGIFIALLLRFDLTKKNNSYIYFYTSMISYVLGLTITVIFLAIFNHAQPALLYLVPCCVLIPLFVALIKGDIKALFEYKDHPNENKDFNETKNLNETKDLKESKEVKQD